ncbi:MAG: PAS domain-containing protein [Anaerolineae bacterium]|nr:PAS domain-containing protein [Anaerolineae bacterium]
MLVVDLRWALFGILVLGFAITGLVVWLAHRPHHSQDGALPFAENVHTIFERAPFGLVLLDDPGRHRYANPYAQRLLGLSASPGTLPLDNWTETLAQDCAAAQDESMTAGRYRGIALGEKRYVRWWVTAWHEAEGDNHPAFAMFVLDATAQQHAEQMARDLFSDLAHELRTPIATILTHLQVLRLPDLVDDMREQSLNLVQVEARRMSRMSNALLELGRLQVSGNIERRPVDLLPLVQEIVTQMMPLAREKNVALELESDAPLELVIGDAERLKQVFLNLLDNALKYVRSRDRVVVTLRQRQQDVLCAVSDNAPGIPARHLPHVTKRFYRGVPEGSGGSGLGLALVKEILEHHQSNLEIESKAEGDETGTCVRFSLPILPGDEEQIS